MLKLKVITFSYGRDYSNCCEGDSTDLTFLLHLKCRERFSKCDAITDVSQLAVRGTDICMIPLPGHFTIDDVGKGM